MNRAIHEGAYARKQINSGSRLIAWSHSARFRVGLELGGSFARRTVLDYGCGDGTYLALLMDSDAPPARAIGAEISEDLVRSNRERFGSTAGLEFVTVTALSDESYTGAFDAVICMEVLEHVLDPEWFLDEFRRLLAPGGTLLLSVPAEIGMSVVVKQAVRRINGWRGIGDYPGTTPYTLPELARSVFAGARQHIRRPVHWNPDGSEFHDHKGFNWRWLRERIRERYRLEEVRMSPVRWLPGFCASQVWFRAIAEPARR